MSVSLVVRRGSGSHPGDEISDPLITTLQVALARGRNELDERASGLQDVKVSMPYRPGIRMGQVVEVKETLFGDTWYGKIAGITHSFGGDQQTTELSIKRPTEFQV